MGPGRDALSHVTQVSRVRRVASSLVSHARRVALSRVSHVRIIVLSQVSEVDCAMDLFTGFLSNFGGGSS